jgi:hypothetical protein
VSWSLHGVTTMARRRFDHARVCPDFYPDHALTSSKGAVSSFDFEIDLVAGLIRGRLAHDPTYAAVQTIPGIGPTLGALSAR